MRNHPRKQLVIRPFLLAFALTLAATLLAAAAQAQAAASQQITIPYALLLHVDAHHSTTTKHKEGVIVTAEVKTPLNVYLHTNDVWRLTITTQDGQQHELEGPHGVHELTAAQLGLEAQDGEQVSFTVTRQANGNQRSTEHASSQSGTQAPRAATEERPK